jgi:hypothetical protein
MAAAPIQAVHAIPVTAVNPTSQGLKNRTAARTIWAHSKKVASSQMMCHRLGSVTLITSNLQSQRGG